MKRAASLLTILLLTATLWAAGYEPQFSTAGFYELEGSGRKAYCMNLAWRFYKGVPVGDPAAMQYDDAGWEVVALPHGLEYEPVEVSGCANYQGVAWYRKHFTFQEEWSGRRLFLHFEGIMGKSRVYVNGHKACEHLGGYLPVIVDVTSLLNHTGDNVVAVWADNSDDGSYPPGKPQNMLDFAYLGGIYRDCWMVAHGNTYITDPNYENEVAGGGLFVSYDKVSEESALVNLKAHVRNVDGAAKRVKVTFTLALPDGSRVTECSQNIDLPARGAAYSVQQMRVKRPRLWSPESPNLYRLEVTVKEGGRMVDGYWRRIGIRSIEFKQSEGLWINGKPYKGKIMGTNRHQDFAVLGAALPNSLQWRDAKKLRDAGLKVIRTHYVIDPAFMDACDELGLFALVEVPGWQYWNNDSLFGARVYQDIRDMIRIHRNHASLFFWEPILNETSYPADFACRAAQICKEEYPYPYSIAACDDGARGYECFDLLLRPTDKLQPSKTYFIREWGDNVDDWNAQNSDSRCARNWGEQAMLTQALHYGCPPYDYLCYETICKSSPQIVGACFWHSFDHQRGYHADPFYGGIMDAFRQPKTSYYMFMSQRPVTKEETPAQSGPMVYIANALTPFSPSDVTVYSNCDEVRLTVCEGGETFVYHKDSTRQGMPSPIITFKDAFDFMKWKALARSRKQEDAYMLAQGLVNGKVVVTDKRYPAGQPDHIVVRLDNDSVALTADGSDVVTVIAEVVDKRGTVKRLNNSQLRFTVEGEGRLVGEGLAGIDEHNVVWGSAPALVQSTTTAGTIKVTASMLFPGSRRPLEGSVEFISRPDPKREVYLPAEMEAAKSATSVHQTELQVDDSDLKKENEKLRKELNDLKG